MYDADECNPAVHNIEQVHVHMHAVQKQAWCTYVSVNYCCAEVHDYSVSMLIFLTTQSWYYMCFLKCMYNVHLKMPHVSCIFFKVCHPKLALVDPSPISSAFPHGGQYTRLTIYEVNTSHPFPVLYPTFQVAQPTYLMQYWISFLIKRALITNRHASASNFIVMVWLLVTVCGIAVVLGPVWKEVA